MMDILTNLYITQLEILGFTKEYQLLFVFFVGIFILFFFIKPFVVFLGNRNYFAVITYITSTCLLMNVFLVLAFILQDKVLIKIGLESVAFFGLFYVVYLLYRKMTHTQ